MTDQQKKKTAQQHTEKAAFRISARGLVEFSYFQEDITPGSGMEEMQAGTRAHQRRQQTQEGDVERPLSHTFDYMGETVTVFGRMDIYVPGEVPLIEEIKLCGQAPEAVVPAHWAQAAVYGAIIAIDEEVPQVCLRVCYVTEAGDEVRSFEEVLSRESLLETVDRLLLPYMTFSIEEKAHRAQRDASISAMHFPFPGYRGGQREMAAQVYTAIARKKRLFASLPTGTGKSAAVLFPALKALGEGKTGKILYFTSRTTARQSPLNALELMLRSGLKARVMTLSAKEKMCAGYTRCHPADCPRAKGHFLRQGEAIGLLKAQPELWTDARITEAADETRTCPFELALALTEIADVVLLDLNYAFDPFAQLKRMFLTRRDLTLLVDEAHHVVERVRESLSGVLDSGELARYRASFGKEIGRKHPYYKALGGVIEALRQAQPPEGEKEGRLEAIPEGLAAKAEALCQLAYGLMANPIGSRELMGEISTVLRLLAPFLYAAEHLDEDYAVLITAHGKERTVEVYCLLPAKEIARITKRMRGTVFFSATMAPLSATKQLLGGDAEDACFSLPSPFEAERLTVVRQRVSTRYQDREGSAAFVANSIAQAAGSRPGKYIAYFPSYAYLRMVQRPLAELDIPSLIVQESDMDEAARQRFLEAFTLDEGPKLGLCVLGSLFSEGIDLPGEQLIGVMVVGVGLPVPTLRLKAVQACYQRHFGDGFGYACRIPGMQKVLQAGGRVIRTETDEGLILLLDDRYFQWEYASLLPEHWRLQNDMLPNDMLQNDIK